MISFHLNKRECVHCNPEISQDHDSSNYASLSLIMETMFQILIKVKGDPSSFLPLYKSDHFT